MQNKEPPIIESVDYKVVEEVRPPMKHDTFDWLMVFCTIGMFGLLFMVISNTKAGWIDIGYFVVFGMIVGSWITMWTGNRGPWTRD